MPAHKVLSYLRIAFSIMSGSLCVLLIVLWVRSYYRVDVYRIQTSTSISFVWYSWRGTLHGFFWEGVVPNFSASTHRLDDNIRDQPPTPSLNILEIKPRPPYRLPYWLPIVVLVSFISSIWIPWSNRFSLRTLLIAMTLVAILLGAIVFSTR
jgi:hypothetical protein